MLASPKEPSTPISIRNCILSAALFFPFAAFAGDIQINGNCLVGTCPPPSGPSDAIQFGQMIGGPFIQSTIVGFGNGDSFRVAWTLMAAFNSTGTSLVVVPSVRYTGFGPSAGNDVITFNAYQNYYDSLATNWDGTYAESVPLQMPAGLGAGSFAQGQAIYDGQSVGLLTASGPGSFNLSHSVSLSGLTGPTLAEEFSFTFDFGAGTQPGATIIAITPEPSAGVLLIVALVSLGFTQLPKKAARKAS